MGYGKGFYDRYLSAHPKHPTIALALDFQIKEEIPSDTFDVLPDLVVDAHKSIPTLLTFFAKGGDLWI